MLLHQLLTGTPPFDPTLTTQEMWQQHLTTPPRPMQGVPDQIAEVVLLALAKAPDDRPPDADSFAAALADAAVTSYGSHWLADISLPLHLTDRIRRRALPPLLPPVTSSAGQQGHSTAQEDGATARGDGKAAREDDEGAGEEDDDAATVVSFPPPTAIADRPAVYPGRSFTNGMLRTRQRKVLVTAGAALSSAAVALLVLLRSGSHPNDNLAERAAWSRNLTAASTTAIRIDPALARRLPIAAYHSAPIPQAHEQVLALFGSHPPFTLGHAGAVTAVAFSPNGQLLAIAGEEDPVRLWDANGRADIQLQATLTGRAGGVVAVAFSPDGKRLATGSDGRTARLWAIGAASLADADSLTDAACANKAANQLTEAEWRRVLPQAPYEPPCP